MPATNNQMSGQGIQTDIVFFPKPQATVSQVKSLDDVNLVMKAIPLTPSLKEPKFTCNRGKSSMESKETTQGFILFDKGKVGAPYPLKFPM